MNEFKMVVRRRSSKSIAMFAALDVAFALGPVENERLSHGPFGQPLE